MKKLTLFISIVLLFGLTAMVPFDQFSSTTGIQLQSNVPAAIHKSQVEKGMITIKLKKDLKEIPPQRGRVIFDIESLDQLSERYELSGIEKRFRYNPEKIKNGLPDLSRIYCITFPEKYAPLPMAKIFASDPSVEYAEPIPVSFSLELPDDPFYSMQHFLPQIKAEEAWDIHKGEDGTEEVIIGIMDTGVDWDHEDLVENIWQNMGEDADGDGIVLQYNGSDWIFDPDDENGLDDDGNGFIDDFIGWDFYNENNDPDPEPGEDHGTHCAGLASARTNNGTGIASISWNLKIMSMEDHTFQDAYDGIIYAAENGASIISNSWGHYYFSTANHEALQYAQSLGSIIVAAASNDNVYRCIYPASYPGVICVASVNKLDAKATYSNYGPNITLSAPGGEGSANGLFSTVIDGYNWKMGTSMATPVAAGVLGLVKSYHPDWLPWDIVIQVIGTADNIDTLNPDYINQLGSGRINAFRALSETGVTLPQELKIDVLNVEVTDVDGDGIRSPGDTLLLNLTLQNFCFDSFDPEATFQLGTDDPEITVDNTIQVDSIPPCNYFELPNSFQVVIAEDATPHFASLRLTVSTQTPLLYGDTLHFSLFIAPGGNMVFQGPGSGNAYSGQYIKNFLENNGIEVTFMNELPDNIRGFDAVFMSLGNYGQSLDDGTLLTDQMCQSITDYLESGGYLYVECGTMLGILDYIGSTYTEELAELFSIESLETPLTTNYIDTLSGLENSIAEGLYFTGSSQSPNWYIDILTPNENGISMLNENDYGVVAVQGEGAYGQKTVMMNYAISKLQAGEPGMTPELMERICEFLGIVIVGAEEVVQGSRLKVQGYPNPASSLYSIEVSLEQPEEVSVQLYDLMGKSTGSSITQTIASGDRFQLDLSDLQPGIYFCNIRIGSESVTKKIIKN